MQNQKPNAKAKLISEFSKNSLETIRVMFTQFNGKKLLDLRTWVRGEDGESYIPTRKGISLRVEQVEELKEAIDKAAEEIGKGE